MVGGGEGLDGRRIQSTKIQHLTFTYVSVRCMHNFVVAKHIRAPACPVKTRIFSLCSILMFYVYVRKCIANGIGT
jgi:hypothetical protein